jgi:predicted ribosome-associated RNA-binding protein Tma20
MDASKIKSLSKKDKLELLDALEAKRQKQLMKGAHYSPNAGQIKVHESDKKIRIVTAGNGGG